MILHKKITINAPAKQVFSYWANFQNFQQLVSIIESIEILDEKKSRWKILAPMGHNIYFQSLITRFKAGKYLSWESHHNDGYACGELRLSASGDYTLVELDFEYNLYQPWMQNIARIVSHFGFPSRAFDHGLLRIKEKIEREHN